MFARLLATILVTTFLMLAGMTPALADSVRDDTLTVIEMYNPCAPEDGLITFSAYRHYAIVNSPDGVTIFHEVDHYTGVSVVGTRYQMIIASETTSTSVWVWLYRIQISSGSGGNAWMLWQMRPPHGDIIGSGCRG